MPNESLNDQGVKIKNHKFWSGGEFSLAQKVMQTLSSTLNDYSETQSVNAQKHLGITIDKYLTWES